MEIGKQPSFLVLQSKSETIEHIIKLVPTQKEALMDWTFSTRISPLLGVYEYGTADPSRYDFPGDNYIFFVGPVHPIEIGKCVNKVTKLWISLGILNVVICTNSLPEKRKILKWVLDQNIQYELWSVKDGKIIRKQSSAVVTNSTKWRKQLGGLTKLKISSEVDEAIREYAPLMATAMARSERIPFSLATDLNELNQHVMDLLKKPEQEGNDKYQIFADLLLINAGLSRFTSQIFSGTPHITETECHFKSHSLLGIGVPTIALRNLLRFVEATLGNALIPEKFAKLAELPNNQDMCARIPSNNEFWYEDYLSKINIEPNKQNKQVPILGYFSARDGFRSTTTTISAPLATVSACNSVQWSLMTLTHEISHIVIDAVLSILYPDFQSDVEVANALKLIQNDTIIGVNLLEEIRRYLFYTIAGIEEFIDFRSEDGFLAMLALRKVEVAEIMVHVFDFMYFYGQDINKYIKGIWTTWGTLPFGQDRTKDYVIRTICAAIVPHLRRSNKIEELARDQVIDSLKELINQGLGNNHVKQALKYIDTEWDELRVEIIKRHQLVRIVRSFLFSEKISMLFRGESSISGGEGATEGYILKPRKVEAKKIHNPLHFIEVYTTSKTPSLAESTWMFYILAFCLYESY
jgi:hypothetical protein